MVPSYRALATSYKLPIVTMSICSGLGAIFNGEFQAISGRTSETVRDRTKVSTNRKWHMSF